MAAVVSSTPPSTWLPEFSSLVRSRLVVDPAIRARAGFVGRFIDDPALMLSRFPGCDPEPLTKVEAAPIAAHESECLAIIEETLSRAPYSGELWYAKALWLVKAGQTDSRLFEALRMSWRTAHKEGWIARGRVVLGFRLYPQLPEDLKQRVGDDLALVLQYDQFSDALSGSYSADETLRKAAQPALEKLTPQQLRKFIDLVRWKTHQG
ncbi:MAG: hypothetical protein ABI399_02695 [Bauldia sp.]